MTLFQFFQVNNKFGSLTDFLDKSKYVDLTPQRPKIYTYTNAKKMMAVKWKTVKSDDSLGVNTTPVTNILKDKPGPHGAACRVRTSLDAFELYFTDEMLEKIVTYTNASIDHFCAEYPDVLMKDNKKTHIKNVDIVDIRAYFGILYL